MRSPKTQYKWIAAIVIIAHLPLALAPTSSMAAETPLYVPGSREGQRIGEFVQQWIKDFNAQLKPVVQAESQKAAAGKSKAQVKVETDPVRIQVALLRAEIAAKAKQRRQQIKLDDVSQKIAGAKNSGSWAQRAVQAISVGLGVNAVGVGLYNDLIIYLLTDYYLFPSKRDAISALMMVLDGLLPPQAKVIYPKIQMHANAAVAGVVLSTLWSIVSYRKGLRQIWLSENPGKTAAEAQAEGILEFQKKESTLKWVGSGLKGLWARMRVIATQPIRLGPTPKIDPAAAGIVAGQPKSPNNYEFEELRAVVTNTDAKAIDNLPTRALEFGVEPATQKQAAEVTEVKKGLSSWIERATARAGIPNNKLTTNLKSPPDLKWRLIQGLVSQLAWQGVGHAVVTAIYAFTESKSEFPRISPIWAFDLIQTRALFDLNERGLDAVKQFNARYGMYIKSTDKLIGKIGIDKNKIMALKLKPAALKTFQTMLAADLKRVGDMHSDLLHFSVQSGLSHGPRTLYTKIEELENTKFEHFEPQMKAHYARVFDNLNQTRSVLKQLLIEQDKRIRAYRNANKESHEVQVSLDSAEVPIVFLKMSLNVLLETAKAAESGKLSGPLKDLFAD